MASTALFHVDTTGGSATGDTNSVTGVTDAPSEQELALHVGKAIGDAEARICQYVGASIARMTGQVETTAAAVENARANQKHLLDAVASAMPPDVPQLIESAMLAALDIHARQRRERRENGD